MGAPLHIFYISGRILPLMKFDIEHQDGKARSGLIETAHGTIKTPAFMPVGTHAVMRRLDFHMLSCVGNDIFMANTYHLNLRPGPEVIADLGGLHGFTSWQGPWITDSGGFQVFSLSEMNKVTDDGVEFKSHLDGSKVFLGPKESMAIQKQLGSDIVMAFDECPPDDISRENMEISLKRTHKWALECLEHRPPEPQNLYGIVQGGIFIDLREKSRDFFANLPFDGFAMGGLAVGEGHDKMVRVLKEVALPPEKPRYLMGVGWPKDIFAAVAEGYDQFDCVLPSRNGRNGTAFTRNGKVNIKRKEMQRNAEPIEEGCGCVTCQRYSRGYLHHLLHIKEVLGGALISLHNLYFYEQMMTAIRGAIKEKRFEALRKEFLENFDGE